jgi:hypothetical protein
VGDGKRGDERAAPHGKASIEDGQPRANGESGARKEQRDGCRPQPIGWSADLLPAGGDRVEQPESRDRDQRRGDSLAADTRRDLWRGEQEGNGRQPDPRSEQGDRGRPDQRRREEEDGQRRRCGAQQRWRREHGDESERRHELRIVADRDERRDDRRGERGGHTGLGRNQAEEAGRREERQRDDREPDGNEDVTDDSPEAHECQLADSDRRRAAGEADQDTQRFRDPAAAEGEAQEERGAQDERDAAHNGQHPTLEPRLDRGPGNPGALVRVLQAHPFQQPAAKTGARRRRRRRPRRTSLRRHGSGLPSRGRRPLRPPCRRRGRDNG